MMLVRFVNMRVFGVFLWCVICARGFETSRSYLDQSTTQIPDEAPYQKSKIAPQADGFSSKEIHSGPLVFVNKTNVFVSNLWYEPNANNTHFCVNGSFSPGIVTLSTKTKGTDSLSGYYGSVEELWFPENITTDHVEHLGICDDNIFLVSVNLNEVIDKNKVSDNDVALLNYKQNIFRIPKCCSHNEVLDEDNKCTDSSSPTFFVDIPVLQSNRTHVDINETVTPATFIPYNYVVNCRRNEISVIVDSSNIYGMIFNTSLLVHQVTHLLSPGGYCVDQFNNETLFVICFPNQGPPIAASFTTNLYLILLVISTICFAVAALCYWYVLPSKSNQDVQKKSFVGYASSMCLTFCMLILLHMINKDEACNGLGAIFLFSSISSFAWLAILCVDLTYTVYNFENYTKYANLRFYSYVGISSGIAILIMVISLSIPSSGVPDVPAGFIKNSGSSCNFTNSNLAVSYVPICFLIIISVAALAVTKYFIIQNDKMEELNHFWVDNKMNYKFMWSQGIMTLFIASLSVSLELVLNLMETTFGFFFAVSIIESVQGILVMMILFTNKHRSYILVNIVAFLWFLEVAFSTFSSNIDTIAALDLLEASLGILNFIVFVIHDYPRKELKKKFKKNNRQTPTEESLRLQNVATPASPEEKTFLFPRSTTNQNET